MGKLNTFRALSLIFLVVCTVGGLLLKNLPAFNSLGRLCWGMISDKLGRMTTVTILLLSSGILSLLVNFANGYFIHVIIGLIGLFYGGFLSNFPSLTADLFGPKHMTTNYGMVLLGFGAVISSYIAGHFKNVAAQDISLMFPAFFIAEGCAGVGIVLMLILKKISAAKQSSFHRAKTGTASEHKSDAAPVS